MNRAVFLDRDGVINPLVYNPKTKEYESPHSPEDFSIFTYTLKALRLLKEAGFFVFVVSNQPSYAKGKTTMENIKAIEKLLSDFANENGGLIDEYFYCYHHPKSIVPELTRVCRCRKPGTLFLENAARDYRLDMRLCYMAGDRDTDIECGNAAGVRTIRITPTRAQSGETFREPAFASAQNLIEAVKFIIEQV